MRNAVKKALCIAAVTVLIGASGAKAADFELLYPQRVSLYTPETLEPNQTIKLNNENVIDYTNGKQGDITGRTIISEQSGNGAAAACRFRTAKYIYGSQRWKNSFTYEFDFEMETLENFLMIKLGSSSNGANIKFTKDSKTEQYYISWENDSSNNPISHPIGTIWGHKEDTLLQYGKTYHLKIEADMSAGGKIVTTFSDPETGYVRMSSKSTGLNVAMDTFANTETRYTFSLVSNGKVKMKTSDEKMFYERFFMWKPELSAEADSSEIRADAKILNCINDNSYSPADCFKNVPYLFLGIYDENGALVKSAGEYEGDVPAQKSADALLLTAFYDYHVSTDVSDLPDGDYTVKTFMWRNPEEMYVCTEVTKKTIHIENGIVAQTE